MCKHVKALAILKGLMICTTHDIENSFKLQLPKGFCDFERIFKYDL